MPYLTGRGTVSEENFSIVSEDAGSRGQGGCGQTCPLAQIPAQVWKNILRPPFRKRHPVVFWIATILPALLLLYSLRAFLDDESLVDDDCLGLVSINGPILNVAPALEWIGKLENNSAVKGVILRVDSPGGGASASQELYSALARLAQKKPVVASMGATSASGGLMVCMAAERIFANPSTITGSIGVRMDIPQLQNLMNKIGIGQETLVSGAYKDAASYTRPLSEKDRVYLQGILNDMHNQFVDIVAKGRHMAVERARELATGKIFTGREAMSLGLVDVMGGQAEAIAWLANKTGVPPERRLLKKQQKKGMLEKALLGMAQGWLSGDNFARLEQMAASYASPAFLYQF